MNKPFNFSFSSQWKLPYIAILSSDDELLDTRYHASRCLSDMQHKLSLLSVYSMTFMSDVKTINHCVHSLKTIINQCDYRLNPVELKDNVLYTDKLSGRRWGE